MSLWEQYKIYNSSRKNRRKMLDKDDYYIPNNNAIIDVSITRYSDLGRYVHEPSHMNIHYLYSNFGEKRESEEHEFKIIS